MKKIGLFGGSFDPIHFGHLNLCVSLLESEKLDEILFCPASVSPFKGATPPLISQEHRREMVKRAIAPFSQFALLDIELDRQGPSYTIDTVNVLLNRFKSQNINVQLHLILGGDIIAQLPLWKEVDDLIRLAPPLIGSRGGKNSLEMPHFSVQTAELVAHGLTPVPVMEISSTAIRERLCQQKTCRHLVPGNVLDYIEEHRLYSHGI